MSTPAGRRQAPGPGPRGIVLLVVAVVLGVVLLRDLDSPPQLAAPASTTTTADPLDPGVSETPVTTVPTTRPPGEVKVLVVNAANTNGLAGTKTKEVQAAGYSALAPVTALNNVKIEATTVQYTDDYIEEARGVARVLGLSPDIVAALSQPPVRTVGGANVIVVLGADADPPEGQLPATTTTSTTSG